MVTIRPYRPEDRSAVYDICVRTGAAGEDARGRHSTDDLLGDLFAGPYVTLEPQWAFVLDDEGDVTGYVIGTADTAALVERWTGEWVPYLEERYPEPRAGSDRSILRFGLHPERMLLPELAGHPAHLHIDLLPRAQGGGLGRQLIATFLRELAAAGVPAVHLGVDPANVRALGFYAHLGFREIPTAVPGLHLGRATGEL
ncbi:GNAT family N-acetyltransferase [Kineosporia succinea]|uniref:Ribosomal protein S18 acetylase RimI-like enzyme n=1 Tax=Kineosporia succinea TaxID=84632 RepID=A0ABT9PEK7_9ACTN|nr:GNAT family N-acetyltransferase [Kineosporia succinea]MDP9831145.1 ribosomal protein S18 acetylase RimI-like enzyme [Kineosporia succinea]